MIISDLTIKTPAGLRVDLPTHRASNIVVQNTKHGFGKISFDLPLSPAQLVILYGNPQVLDITLKHAGYVFNGRLEDIQIQNDHVTLTALGYWRSLNDVKYSAMWSVTILKEFTQHWLGATDQPTANRKFNIDVSNGVITIGLIKNTVYGANEFGLLWYQIPHGSNRQITAIQADFSANISANVTLRIQRLNITSTFPFFAFQSNIASRAGIGAVDNYNYVGSFTGADIVAVGFEITTGHLYAGETGAEYVKITNLRLVSDASRQINTTLSAVRTGGTAVTVTVVTTANMYIGQRVFLQGGGKNESTVILTIPSSTTFTADINNAPVGGYPIGTLVLAYYLNPDQIVSGLVTYVNGLNSTQLASNTGLIQTAAYDLLDEVYEDKYPSDIVEYLCGVGDGTNQFEAGVYENKQVYYRIRNSTARTWYIDYEDPNIRTSLDKLFNSYYANYKDYFDRDLRTATATDTTSVSRYGVTRLNNIDVSTPNVTLANKQRDLAVSANKTILPQADVVVSKIWVNASVMGRLEDVRPGDYIIVMSLPPVVYGTGLDLLRTFRVVETSLAVDTAQLTITPEVLLPSLVRQVAQLLVK